MSEGPSRGLAPTGSNWVRTHALGDLLIGSGLFTAYIEAQANLPVGTLKVSGCAALVGAGLRFGGDALHELVDSVQLAKQYDDPEGLANIAAEQIIAGTVVVNEKGHLQQAGFDSTHAQPLVV